MPVFLRLWLGENMGLDCRAGSLGLTIHYESNTTAAVRIVSRYFFNIFVVPFKERERIAKFLQWSDTPTGKM